MTEQLLSNLHYFSDINREDTKVSIFPRSELMYFWAVHVSSGSPVVQHHHPLTKWVTTSVHKHITVLVFTSLTSGDVNLSLLLSHLTCEQSAFLAHWLLPFICDQADFLILGQTFSHSPLWQRHRSWCVDVHWWFTSTDLEAVSLQSKLLDQPSVLCPDAAGKGS